MKTLTISIILVVGFAASLLSNAEEPSIPSLDRAAREAVIAAANRAIQKHMAVDQRERKGNEIAKAYWGDAIAHLKPLRVLDDRVNVFIVLKEDETAEEGLYVSIPISSYAPGADKRFLVFEKLTQPGDKANGALYRFKLRKAQRAAAPDGGPTKEFGNSDATESRPLPGDIKDFVADRVASAPSDYFKGFKVTQKDFEIVLKDYFQVGEEHWRLGYSHVAFGDRTGYVILKDGRKVKWMVKPGGLAWLKFPSGKKICLAAEKTKWPLNK